MIQIIENLDSKVKIIFPDGYIEEESKIKGWLQVRVLLPNGKIYELIIITQMRLDQEISQSLINNICYFEPNLIVISEITVKKIKDLIEYLYKNNQFKTMSSC
ncbi:MAG: hypothetical protein NTV81_04780 [Candidatus Komeilibacteria bacterium]|nr:hypothetical protein [Candidatus Komeilibacteria bacterium]